ncbi:PREDICTED: GATA transcription factor 7 [Brassica oleracea var. oleracea]|uniref:GATA transcription factor n=1 Tax=Brassica oleracea var. oleracea TaxID=109376 RepID=A0A0D3A1J9_BRAOL|nr:PREDICTED: GATA transcription factor 7 [Brassica oleracea var. oleracea]
MEYVEAFLSDFSVDDLLDLSNTDAFVREKSSSSPREEEREKANSSSDQITLLSPLDDILSLPGSGPKLNAPVGDLEDLEWLSNFVDDSFSDYHDFPVNPVASVEVQRQYVPVKPRSKRRRTNGHLWSLESPYSSLYTAVSTEKKKRGRPKAETSSGDGVQQQTRRCCSHCGVQKTPQWRMGPLGAKTLCNACGVRFKSGRLLPEYRPACSPTFSTEIHSNSHRKVLELRLTKTADQGQG